MKESLQNASGEPKPGKHLGRGWQKTDLEEKERAGTLTEAEGVKLAALRMPTLPNALELLQGERAGTLSPNQAATLTAYKEFPHANDGTPRELAMLESIGSINQKEREALGLYRQVKSEHRSMTDEESAKWRELLYSEGPNK